MNAEVFQALADPTRLRIIESLQDGERAVNDIVDRVEVHQSGVSRHLRILRGAGFVRLRPAGSRHLYSLRPERFRELDRWVAGYRALWESRLGRLEQALERGRAARAVRRERMP